MPKLVYTDINILSAPYYEAEIAGITIGSTKNNIDKKKKSLNLSSLEVVRLASDSISSYDLNKYKIGISFVPSIEDISDPNYFEKLLSLSKCEMKITYGDAAPVLTSNTLNQSIVSSKNTIKTSYLYKRESVFITDYQFNMDFSGNSLVYDISGTSAVYQTKEDSYTFPRVPKGSKISSVIESTYNEYLKYQYFSGNDIDLDTDDKIITESIDSFTGSPINYIKKLSQMMVWTENSIYNNRSKLSVASYYFWITNDTIGKTVHVRRNKILSEAESSSETKTVVIDIGYPRSSGAIDFIINNSVGYAHIFDGLSLSNNNTTYSLDEEGNVVSYDKLLSGNSGATSESGSFSLANWWSFMQLKSFTGTLKIHGIINNIKLMDIIKINLLYNGMEYYASGYYYVESININISSSSFYSVLGVTKIPGGSKLTL